jgi:hypothetical protein
MSNRPNILAWLNTHGLDNILLEADANPDQNYREYLLNEVEEAAVQFGNIDVLIKLVNIGKNLNSHNVRRVISQGRIDILQLYETHNMSIINQDQDEVIGGVQDATESGVPNIIDLLRWLSNHGVIFDESNAYATIISNNIDVLNFLATLGVYPNNDSIIYAMMTISVPTLQCPQHHGTIFDRLFHMFAAITKDNIEAVKWLSEHGLTVDSHTADIAVQYHSTAILNWLHTLGIYETNT